MEIMRGRTLKTLLLISLSVVATLSVCESLPLSTKGRWIVDDVTGRRVKLKCVNWISHTESMITEGLHSQPIGDIVDKISEMGFNCVRLTYPTFLWTRADYYNKTVAESLDSLNATEAKAMISVHNPRFLSLPLRESYERVVGEVGRRGLMLILDNHVSKPMWCCAREDGNGFFGDEFFDPKEWIEGLSLVANRFKGESHVIGMSMRNELRGRRSNQKDWYKYMRKGAKAIHSINPDLLVLVSGLNFDKDLSFLKNKPFGLTLNNKVVFEAHWYSFDATEQWENKPPEQECKDRAEEFYRDAVFLTEGDNPAPLFISEFGMDLRMGNVADNRYFNCYLPTVAAKDLDWALWTLQASYYYRQGNLFLEEVYSVLDFNWEKPRNPQYLEKLTILQEMLQDPNSKALPYYVIVHAKSGLCVNVDGERKVHGSGCRYRTKWTHSGDGWPIELMGGNLCLKAVGDRMPVKVSSGGCWSQQSRWRRVSNEKLHLAVRDEHDHTKLLCLDASSSDPSSIVTRKCTCKEGDLNCHHEEQSNWFQLVPSNIP